MKPAVTLLALSTLLGISHTVCGQPKSEAKPYGIARRVPWTTPHVTGTPEPPPPYRAQRIFPKISFDRPTVLASAPGTDRFFVAEHGGKIYSIANQPDVAKPDLFLDVQQLVSRLNRGNKDPLVFVAVYGLTFHPNFAKNRYCYVCYVVKHKDGDRGQHPRGTRVVRLRVTKTDPPRCEVDSEHVVITWLQGGHNGGCLKFGPEGFLYISTGDGGFAFPPDGLDAGQDVSNLLSAILRIDADRPDGGRPYTIPPDNPFRKLKNARGEIWAYGLRNPWKMSFDRKTGDLWVGDVGWELWELVYRVRPGDNYGWSLVEGRQPVHAERRRGPTPIVPPTVEIPHTDGASVTGGFVYRGQRFPELDGTYIFGDWETRRIWGVRYEADKNGGQRLTEKRDLLEPTVRIVGFAEDHAGELYLLDYDDGTIHEIVRNDVKPSDRKFPRRLSESGLFASAAEHRLAPGVVPFSINAEQWADHAIAQRFIAVPGTGSIKLHPGRQRIAGSMFHRKMDFPKDSVVAKTLSLEMEHGKPSTRRRIETQLLHYDGRFWRGYSYQWNAEQTDALLVDAAGQDGTFAVRDPAAPGGKRTQAWHFASRMECIRCHNPWAEHTLAFNIPQLNRDHDYGGAIDNQVRTLRHVGLIADVLEPLDPDDPPDKRPRVRLVDELPRLADPFDEQADLAPRARAYLHANCAHCHRANGGGSAYVHLNHELAMDKTRSLGERPAQGTLGIHNAEIIAAGDPYRSVLYFRMAKLGSGRMPHIGSKLIDERGLALVHDWIAGMSPPKNPGDVARRLADLAAAKGNAKQRAGLIADLLSTSDRALRLADTIRRGRVAEPARRETLAAAMKHAEVQIRDLFEPFVPEEQRAKRLGEVIRPSQILSLTGDATRGKQLFHNTASVQCKNCHRIGKLGTPLGPDLTGIAKKNTRAQLLESILEPSKNIDPKYLTYIVETTSGQVYPGLLIKKTAKEVILKTAQTSNNNKELRIPTTNIERLVPQRKSLMPDLLLRDMTAQQVADLLAYLGSLK